MNRLNPSNSDIADTLDKIADLLEAQNSNEFRVRAYRNGARTIRESNQDISRIVKKYGKNELIDFPDIGNSLANIIIDYVEKGRSSVVDRLKGEMNPEDLLLGVSGIGEELAGKITEKYDIHSLEELECAACDGRLETIRGIGEERLEVIKNSLAARLSRSRQRHKSRMQKSVTEPPVKILLDVDREYRNKADKGELKKISPKRFNPKDKSWLPILHTERGPWHFTVLFSNTKRAHDLNKTDDWVVIYFEKEDTEEDQCTVVTETRGDLQGRRVIRGREEECKRYYSQR